MIPRDLLKSNLIPSKLSISKAFDTHQKNVEVKLTYDVNLKSAAFNISIRDAGRSLDFSQLTAIHDDSIECKVFGTKTLVCKLDPKFPACTGCPLNR